jgi:hypothetical protein
MLFLSTVYSILFTIYGLIFIILLYYYISSINGVLVLFTIYSILFYYEQTFIYYILEIVYYLLCTWFSTYALKITDHNSHNLLGKLSDVDVSRPINNIGASMCQQWLFSNTYTRNMSISFFYEVLVQLAHAC